MRKINYLYGTLLAGYLLAMSACQEESEKDSFNGKEVTLSFAPTLSDMNQTPLPRATKNSFFSKGNKITVNVITNRPSAPKESFTYAYGSDGIFTGDFRFKLDNTYITTLEAIWPTQDIQTEGIITDQRELEDYQQADRLKSVTTIANIMPTAEPVPLTFEHVQSRFSFRMAGQNANGLVIQSIILEMQADLDGDQSTAKTAAAFWANCPGNETAGLILIPGTEIKGTGAGYQIVEGRYMIGQATVGTDDTNYTGGIWLDENTSLTLAGGTDYLVTLTPEGYNLIASIEIGGFGQNEGYVGIPIQLPAIDQATGKYTITNANQLVTLSRILAGDKINNQTANVWKGYTYTLPSTLTMTANAKLYYKPITDDSLKSKFDRTTIKDEAGQDFNLFKN